MKPKKVNRMAKKNGKLIGKSNGKIKSKKNGKIKKKKSFREQVENFQKTDPELYEFLKNEEADLLEFDDEDSEGSGIEDAKDDAIIDGGVIVDEKKGASKKKKKKKAKSSEAKPDAELSTDPKTGRTVVDAKLLEYLDVVLTDPAKNRSSLGKAVEISIQSFLACVAHVGSAYSKLDRPEFVLNDQRVFDGVIRLCFAQLGKCLLVLLNPVENRKKKRRTLNSIRHKGNARRRSALTLFKHWHKYSALTKDYLSAVHIFLIELQNNDVIVSAVRAVMDLVDLYLHFPKLCKSLIKTLVQLWSRKSEEIRCISFVALCKISRLDNEFFPVIYKSCYVSYIANSKVVDEGTLPFIHFMRSSFAELTFLHPNLAYQYAFVYIRQFAIHLRNAVIAKRKDLVQTIYNWQFLLGLELWTTIICKGTQRFQAQSWFSELAHPLVEIICITRKVFPSNKYLPLRIHCIRMLLQIQRNCQLYIPTLAFSVELLDDLLEIDEKKPIVVRGKSVQKLVPVAKQIRIQKHAADDVGFRQHLAEQMATLCQDAIDVLKADPALPYILVPINVKLKKFCKKCRNRDHVKLFKRLISSETTDHTSSGSTRLPVDN